MVVSARSAGELGGRGRGFEAYLKLVKALEAVELGLLQG